jgi:hypothetical protein
MPVATDDTRTFRSAVEISPEDQQSNNDYFREQGSAVEYEGQPSGTEPAQAESATPAKAEPETSPVVARTPPESEDHPDRGADADPSGASDIDGEKPGKPGWRAKKTQQIRDLEAQLAAQNGANEELRRQLAAKGSAPTAATPATSLSPAPVAEAPQAEPPKAREFEKPKPARPKFEDFQSAEDPIAAHADAVAEYADKVSDWKDAKREFEAGEQKAIQDQTRERASARQAQVEQQREVQERVDAMKLAHPDFEEVTGNKFNPVLAYVLREAVPDGLEIGYQLGKHENADLLGALREVSQHKETDSQRVIERKIAQSLFAVAEISQKLKERGSETKNPPPAAKAAAAASEQTPPPSAPKAAAPPRSVEATPAPSRSRGAAADRLEDIPKGDYDARRKWRETHGEL